MQEKGGGKKDLAQLIENVVVALAFARLHDAGFFEQVVDDLGTHDVVFVVKGDFDPLSETTAIVVAHGLGVTEGLYVHEHQPVLTR